MPTLTTLEILAGISESFKQSIPFLKMMSTDFRSDTAALNQDLMMHIRKLPTMGAYDAANGGYFNGANESRDLLEDVPVTIDSHNHVTVSVSHLNAISDNKEYGAYMADMAYVLGKGVIDSILAKLLAANISRTVTEALPNVSRATLGDARIQLNKSGAHRKDRYVIASSDFTEALGEDGVIESKDFHGQLGSEEDSYSLYKNVKGFKEIMEYPDFPDNGEFLEAVGFDPRLIGLRTALPIDTSKLAAELGLAGAPSEVYTDPETGLSLLGIVQQDPGTTDIYMTVTLMWGSTVGMAGGAADDKTDKAGVRFVTQ